MNLRTADEHCDDADEMACEDAAGDHLMDMIMERLIQQVTF